MNNDLAAIIIGSVAGLAAAVPCALLLIALLRKGQRKDEYGSWSVTITRPALPEVDAQPSPLALPEVGEITP